MRLTHMIYTELIQWLQDNRTLQAQIQQGQDLLEANAAGDISEIHNLERVSALSLDN